MCYAAAVYETVICFCVHVWFERDCAIEKNCTARPVCVTCH